MFSLKYLVIPAIAVALPAFADDYFRDNKSFSQEIMSLKVEIKILGEEISRLGRLIESDHLRETHNVNTIPKAKWGCYLVDIIVGGVYGVGNTIAEAKG